jgi:hypothetical protein
MYALWPLSDRSTHITVEHVTRIETTTVLSVPTPPIVISIPAPVSTATDTRACPIPRTDAPSLVPPKLPEDVKRLAVSPTNAGWIAAWNDDHLFVSTDAGRTFHRTLDGVGDVHAAQFDCFGNVVVVRGDQIGIAVGAHETWNTVAGLDLATEGWGDEVLHPNVALIGGRDVIVVGRRPGDEGGARVAVSHDLATTWRYHDMGDYSAPSRHAAGFQRADGSIVVGVTVPDCMTEHLSWIEIAANGASKTHESQIFGEAFQFWNESIISTYGRRKMSAPDDSDWKLVGENEWWGVPIPAPYPVFVTAEKAARFVGGKLRDYPWILDEGEERAMDPAGRLWTIACGQLWIARKDRASGYCLHDPNDS